MPEGEVIPLIHRRSEELFDTERQFDDPHGHSFCGHCQFGWTFVCKDGAYLVGPLARYALNFDHLPAGVRALAAEAGLAAVCNNPFRSIIVRAIEIVYACEEALA